MARRSLTTLLLLAVLAAASAGPARAQVAAPAAAPAPAADPQAPEVAAVEQLLNQALAEFSGDQQGRSIGMFDEVVGRLEALRSQAPLGDKAKALLVQALELRGRAYYNTGQQEKAAESFKALIQLLPSHTMSRDQVSPKIVGFFEGLKKVMVGQLAVTSKPAGARVTLDGAPLGITDFFPVDVLAGEHRVEVSRDGYTTEARMVQIAPRATETLQVDLVRSAASSFFLTDPSGVEIWVDGQLRATTSGALPLELAEQASARGLDPSRASAPTEVSNLSLGSHVVELRKRCFETVRLAVEVPEPQDYQADPVKLEDSVGSLTVQSDPPGARIQLDGEVVGVTPKVLDRVCSGRHRLEVKHSAGKFIQDLTLQRNEALTLDAPIRPSLAYLGLVGGSGVDEKTIAELDEKLLAGLRTMKALNFIVPPRDMVDRVLEAERLNRRAVAGGVEPDALRRATEKLAAALEVQGFLLAVLPEEKLQRRATLHLLAAGNTVSDQYDVVFADPVSVQRFLSAVDARTTLEQPWTGAITVDTLLHDGVPVLRTVPGSPAAAAGLQPGEVVYAADGKPVKQTADLLAVIAAKRPQERLALSVRGAGAAQRVAELTLGRTPQEIPLNDPRLLYNKVMMDLRQQVEGYPGTEAAAFARLNLALAAMHFGDFAGAHEHLVKARAELPARPGLSQGTALYYLGLALDRLNYRAEAVEAYRAAAAFKDATLFNNDGPSVATLAERKGAQP